MGPEASADLDLIYAPVREDLRFLGEFLQREFASSEPFVLEILRHISRFRGKQIRPALLFLTHRAGGGRPGPHVVKIAAVIEMVHTATLVHDDILDDARLRRKVETVHTRWGERAAILIGDFIYSRAFQLSTEVDGMAGILSETTHAICEGELLQIGSRYVPDLSEEVYFEIIRKKTAVLHAIACRIGGVLAGLDDEVCRQLQAFGLDLGMAFQIVDDCLDYAGKEAIVGKSLGTDLRQGKVTLPVIYLRETLSPADAAWLDGALSSRIDPENEHRIQELIRDRGVLRDAFGRAAGFLEAAKARLGQLGSARDRLDGSAVESLGGIADYVLRRNR